MDKQRKTSNLINIIDYDVNDNVLLGEHGISLGFVDFDNTPTTAPTNAGSMYWNDADGTANLILKGGEVTLQIGQETLIRVVNKTATNINLLQSNYQAVRITGAQGQRPKVDLAQATNDILSAETIGLVTETINNNQEGFINTSGLIRGINTTGSLQGETWADGDVLYLSPTVAGNVTKVKPVAPNHLVIIGYVIHAHITQGTIFVKVDNGYELDELHNVKIDTPLNDQSLVYNSTTQIWENKTLDIPTLQEVTDAGYVTTNPIDANLIYSNGMLIADEAGTLLTNSFLVFKEGANVKNLTSGVFDNALSQQYLLPDRNNENNNILATEFIIKSASFTAQNDQPYTTTATLTVTDPTPVTGKGFQVHVISGTSTIGGVAYTSGALVYRYYNGTVWVSTDMNNAITIDATPTDGSTNAVSSNGVFDALATKFTLPTLTSGSVLFSNGSTIAQDNANLFWDDTNNRLGIGTNTPANALDVKGVIRAFNDNGSGSITIQTTGGVGYRDSSLNLMGGSQGSNNFTWVSDGLNNYFKNVTSSTGSFRIRNSSNTDVFAVTFSGNTMIGTTTDNGGKLQIRSAAAISTDIALKIRNSTDTTDLVLINGLGNLLVNTSTDNGGKLQIKAPGALSTDIAFRVRNSADSADLVQIQGDGNVGIGTSAPAHKLHITGNFGSYTAGLLVENTGNASDANKNVALFIGNRGNASNIDDNTNIGIWQKSNIVNNYGIVNFFNSVGSLTAFFGCQYVSHSLTQTGNLIFGTVNAGSVSEKMRISAAGFVGIGTTSPAARLDVRAQGALSTDIAFRVRNSADSADLFTVNGEGGVRIKDGILVENQSTFWAPIIALGVVRIGSNPAANSSILDVQSTTKGFLPPRMTNAQRLAIASPAVGLIVYCTDATEGLYENTSAGWVNLNSSLPLQVTPVTLLVAGWTLVSGLYEYNYSNANIFSTSIVDVIPSNSTIAIVQTAGFLPSTLSTSGSVKLYANNLPSADIVVTFNIFN